MACKDCKCKFSFIERCGSVNPCADTYWLYVGTELKNLSVLVKLQSKKGRCLTISTKVNTNGYVYFSPPKTFINKFVEYYDISVTNYHNESICLFVDCKETTVIRFSVSDCSVKTDEYINKPCTPLQITCTRILNALKKCKAALNPLKTCKKSLNNIKTCKYMALNGLSTIDAVNICGNVITIGVTKLIPDGLGGFIVNPVLQQQLDAIGLGIFVVAFDAGSGEFTITVTTDCPKPQIQENGVWADMCGSVVMPTSCKYDQASFEGTCVNYPKAAQSMKLGWNGGASPANPNPINNQTELLAWLNSVGVGAFGFQNLSLIHI
jgi:hypothetical protein